MQQLLSYRNITLKIVGVMLALFLLFGYSTRTFAVDFAGGGNCSGLTGSSRTKCEACRGAGATGYDEASGKCQDGQVGTAEEQVNSLVTTAINIFSFIVGVISVIMIIIGGLKYVTSNGDSGAISSAKNTIIYAVIGLVVVAFAQVIVLFVINKTTQPAATNTTQTP